MAKITLEQSRNQTPKTPFSLSHTRETAFMPPPSPSCADPHKRKPPPVAYSLVLGLVVPRCLGPAPRYRPRMADQSSPSRGTKAVAIRRVGADGAFALGGLPSALVNWGASSLAVGKASHRLGIFTVPCLRNSLMEARRLRHPLTLPYLAGSHTVETVVM